MVHFSYIGVSSLAAGTTCSILHLWRYVEARFRNHCCRGNNKYDLFSECVFSLSYSTYTVHASHLIVICGLAGSTIFFDIIS